MLYQVCPDDETLSLNGSGALKVDYDANYQMSSTGLAFLNTLGYMRSFTPRLFSNSTEITYGATTRLGVYNRVRIRPDVPYVDVTFGSMDIVLTTFQVDFTLGAGFSMAAGTVNIGAPPTVPSVAWVTPTSGVNGSVNLIDASTSANNRVYQLIRNATTSGLDFRPETGARATNTSPFTYAVPDQIHASGWMFDYIPRVTAL